MRIKIGLFNVLLIMFALFSTATLTYRIINHIIPLNTILGFGITANLLFLYIKQYKNRDGYFLVCVFLCILISFILTSDWKTNINDAIYWANTVLFMWKIADENISKKIYKAVEKERDLLLIILMINNIIIIIGFFISECYTSSWGGHYYIGYAYSNHVLASGVLLNLCLSILLIKNFKNEVVKVILLIPSTVAVLQSGARTYVVSLILIWMVFYIFCIKNRNIKLIIIPATIIGGWLLFINSEMLDKFLNPNAYVKISGATGFTSGRSDFWMIDLNAYKELNPLGLLFGKGFDYPYYINATRYNYRIWCHNDFLECLLSVGIVGLAVYSFSMIKNFYSLNKSFIIKMLISLYFLFTAFVNGLFGYQHYLYSYILLYVFTMGVNSEKMKETKKKRIDKKL